MTKIKTVDGPSSGLNADLLDGYHAASFALSSHTHTFASLTSKPTTLSGYGITDAASSSHTHTFASLTSKPTTLSGYGITDAASSVHTHTFAYITDASSASASDIRSGATGNKFITPSAIEAAAELVTLSDASTIAVDWSSFINGVVTLTNNRTLGAPSNAEPGTVRTILVKSSGSDTLSFHSYYKNPPTVLVTSSIFYMLTIFCETTTNFKVTGFETA